MCKLRGIATLIALSCFVLSPVSAQDVGDNCRLSWIEKNWQDSTDYESVEQAYADQYLQILATRVARPDYENECLLQIQGLLRIDETSDSVTIFSSFAKELSNQYSLVAEYQEYKALAEKFIELTGKLEEQLSENSLLEEESIALEKEKQLLLLQNAAADELIEFLESVRLLKVDDNLKENCRQLIIDALPEITKKISSNEMMEVKEGKTLIETLRTDFERCQN